MGKVSGVLVSPGEVKFLRECANRWGLGEFGDWGWLKAALTHPSWGVPRGKPHSKALEFLGDRVVDLAVLWDLARRFRRRVGGDGGKGDNEMDRLDLSFQERMDFSVDNQTLAESAHRLGLHDVVRREMDKSAPRGGERGVETALADSLEALAGAVYLTQGFSSASEFVARVVPSENAVYAMQSPRMAPAHALMRELRALLGPNVKVRIDFDQVARDVSVQHHPNYQLGVNVDGRRIGHGWGRSVRAAQTSAVLGTLKAMQSPLEVRKTISENHSIYRVRPGMGDSVQILNLLYHHGIIEKPMFHPCSLPGPIPKFSCTLEIPHLDHLNSGEQESARAAEQACASMALFLLGKRCQSSTRFVRIGRKSGMTEDFQGKIILDRKELNRYLELCKLGDVDVTNIFEGLFDPNAAMHRSVLQLLGNRTIRLWGAVHIFRQRGADLTQARLTPLQSTYCSLLWSRRELALRAMAVGLRLDPECGDLRIRRNSNLLQKAHAVVVGHILDSVGYEAAANLLDAHELNKGNLLAA